MWDWMATRTDPRRARGSGRDDTEAAVYDDSNILTDTAFRYINNSLILHIFVYLILFEAIAFLWYALFHWEIIGKDYIEKVDNSALSVVDFILAFLYYLWVQNEITTYTDPVRKYRLLLERIGVLANSVYALGGDTHEARETMTHIHCLFRLLVVYAYRLFSTNNGHIGATMESEDMHCLGPVARKTRDRVLEKLAAVSFYRGTYRNTAGEQMSILIMLLQTHLKALIATRPGDTTMGLHDTQATITDTIVDISVYTPPNYIFHIVGVLFLYFVFWAPFIVYQSFGVLMLLVYPLILYVLMGVYIHRKWMGSAFESAPRALGMDVVQWRHDRLAYLDAQFNARTWKHDAPP